MWCIYTYLSGFANGDFIIISLHRCQYSNVTDMGKMNFCLTKTNTNKPRIVYTISGISYKYAYRTQFNTLGPKLQPNLTYTYHVYPHFPNHLTRFLVINPSELTTAWSWDVMDECPLLGSGVRRLFYHSGRCHLANPSYLARKRSVG